jgi:hypothetical protein
VARPLDPQSARAIGLVIGYNRHDSTLMLSVNAIRFGVPAEMRARVRAEGLKRGDRNMESAAAAVHAGFPPPTPNKQERAGK